MVTSRCVSLLRRSELFGEVREMDRVKGSQHYIQRKPSNFFFFRVGPSEAA